ncbi:UNVERIFIED_CONTAM: hypothetical protein FKN15_071209 [Acipenser sinensis]
MVNSCVIYGCSNTLVSLHEFPKKPVQCRQWVKFMRRTRDWDAKPNSSCICSTHFTEDSFINVMMFKMGAVKKVKLNKDAVPSIYLDGTCRTVASSSSKKRKIIRTPAASAAPTLPKTAL